MVVSEAMMGITAFKAAMDISKGIKDLDDRTKRNEAVIDLQEKILSAQQAQAALVETVRELENEIAALKSWEADKQRYELKDLHKGFFAFILKQGMENGEVPHALCTNCFQKGSKSYLLGSGHPVTHDRSWDCPACKTKIKNQWSNMAALIEKSRSSTPE